MKLRKINWVIIVGIAVTLSASFTASDKYFDIAKNLDIFATIYSQLNKYYVDELNPSDLIESGINAMLKDLDPYTNYIPEDEIEDFRTKTTGIYGGIGAIISDRERKLKVILPYEGYIAHEAGIEIGDEIIEIDGKNVVGKKVNEITDLLKGQINVEISLKIKRYGEEKPLNFNLKRERIHLKNVPYYGMVTKDIGMIKLENFNRNATKEVVDALEELKIQGAKKVILDLRSNPGGLLNEVINISGIFLPKGSEIVSTKSRVKEWNNTYNTFINPIDTEIPIAVIIDTVSASASEILSGVIQDYDRGIIVGQQSFGKGLVQTTKNLSYNAKLKITISKYYIPSGRCIQRVDYKKKRNNNESILPDSLRSAFYTRNKRIVYERGGITPDIKIKTKKYARITHVLINKGLLFDYATEYKHKHSDANITASFKLTEKDFNKFLSWLKGKNYQYKTKSEESLQNLIQHARSEKYYKDIATDIKVLSQKIIRNKQEDLLIHKHEIKELLEQEIITRYHLQKGSIEATFDDNESIKVAVEILNDMSRYNKILNGKG